MASRQYLSGSAKRKLKAKKDMQIRKITGSIDNFLRKTDIKSTLISDSLLNDLNDTGK